MQSDRLTYHHSRGWRVLSHLVVDSVQLGTKIANFVAFSAVAVRFDTAMSNDSNSLKTCSPHPPPVVALKQEQVKKTTPKPLKKTPSTTSFFMKFKQK